MFTVTPCAPRTPHFEATLFLRHSRMLRAILPTPRHGFAWPTLPV